MRPRVNPHYTFDAFVEGLGNCHAFRAARAVAARPGQNFNPLFIHGGAGLGKSHLLHAIVHEIARRDPTSRVVIVSAEHYTSEVGALAKGADSITEFRRKYRECDALLVDDVHFLLDRGKAAEEFFHTFNALHEHEVQIVLTSDRSPQELRGFEERLCSRFEWGMRVQIDDVPEIATRVAILRKKAELAGVELPQPVAQLIAKHVTSNGWALECALLRAVVLALHRRVPLSENVAREVLEHG